MAVTTLELYEKQGQKHTKQDKKVTWREVKNTQKTIQGHLKALNSVQPRRKPWRKVGEKN